MGIRVTEISTPFGGVAWEYTDKPEAPVLPSLQPGRKIEVFISSICGDKGKYDHVRAELKKAIEDGFVQFCCKTNQSQENAEGICRSSDQAYYFLYR